MVVGFITYPESNVVLSGILSVTLVGAMIYHYRTAR